MTEVSIYQRVIEFFNTLSISRSAFASILELPQSTVNNYMRGSRIIPIEFIEAMLKRYPDLSAEWLMRGNGDMFLSPDECQDESIIQVLQHRVDELESEYKKKEQQVDNLIDILTSRSKK